MRLARIALLSAAASLADCASGNKIRADGEVIAAQIVRAKKSGAYRCAPRELAMAEAHLDFAYGEVSEGNSRRAQEHLAVSSENVKKAVVLSKDCGPKQVVASGPVIVRIEPADRDKDGVPDADDECPEVPGTAGNKGCPLLKDTDNDGTPDATDACPNEPGPIENRGCPITDRDKDSIADPEDACPDEQGVPDPDPKRNGCPRKLSMIVVKKDRIEIKHQINFESGKSTLKGAQSFLILDQVTEVLRDYPSIKKVRVEGHTDSMGSKRANQQLSQARAESVVKYLNGQGVDQARIDAIGFGMDRPIATNATEKGRAQNRRTEFNIVERE